MIGVLHCHNDGTMTVNVKSIRDIFARKVSVRLKRSPNHILSLCLQEFPWRFRSTSKATVIAIGLDKKVHMQLFHFQFDRRKKEEEEEEEEEEEARLVMASLVLSPNKK